MSNNRRRQRRTPVDVDVRGSQVRCVGQPWQSARSVGLRVRRPEARALRSARFTIRSLLLAAHGVGVRVQAEPFHRSARVRGCSPLTPAAMQTRLAGQDTDDR